MPHAEETNGTMSQSMTNGDKPSSQFLSHITSYPVVADGIETFKTNPYGAKSLDLAGATYDRFGKPVMPYLQTPMSYAAPYAKKADSLADKGLGQVENHFPIVKEDTQTLKDTAFSYAFFPFHVAGQGRDYLLGAYQDEYQKTANRNDGPGLSTLIQAVISTQLRVTSDVLQVVADYLGPKKEEAKSKRDDLVDSAGRMKDHYLGEAKKKKDAYESQGQEMKDNYASKAQEKADGYTSRAQETKDSYTSKVQETKDNYASKAQETKNNYAAKAQEKSG